MVLLSMSSLIALHFFSRLGTELREVQNSTFLSRSSLFVGANTQLYAHMCSLFSMWPALGLGSEASVMPP